MRQISTLLEVVLMLLGGILGWATLTEGHHWGDDYASYIMQARSLVEGNPNSFVEENAFTINQSTVKLGPVAYPWGTAALLAIPYMLSGLDILALKTPNLVCYLLFLACLAYTLRGSESGFVAIVSVALFAFNPAMLRDGLNSVGSDLPFLLFSTAAVWLTGRVLVERRPIISPLADHLLLGSCLGAAFTIRTNGVLLVLAAVAAQCISGLQWGWVTRSQTQRRPDHSLSPASQPRAMLCAVLVGVMPYLVFALLGLWAYYILPSGGGSYSTYVGKWSWQLIRYQLDYYSRLPIDFFEGIPFAGVAYAASLPLLLVGLVRRLRTDYHVVLYMLATFILCLLWPSRQGLRFLYPILPFYVDYVLLGSVWVCQRFKGLARTAAWTVMIALWLSIVACFAVTATVQAGANLANARQVKEGPFTPTAQSAFTFISNSTPANAVVIFFKPRALRMFTDRRSFQTSDMLTLDLADYLCFYVGPGGYDQLPADAVLELAAQGRLQLVYANQDYHIYQIKRPG